MRDEKRFRLSRGINRDTPFALFIQHSMLFLLCGMVMVLSLISPYVAFGLEKKDPGPSHQNTEFASANSRWSYHGFQGPRFWGYLEQTHRECRIGHQQSPIDVRIPHHPDHQEELKFEYSQTQFSPFHTKHGMQFRPSRQSQLQLNNQPYQLRQFHFHDPSEHHIQGKEFPLEMHLVHEDQAGQLLVVALLFTQGTPNDDVADILALRTRLQHSQAIQNMKNDSTALSNSALNLQHLLPATLHHFSYQGSLTTPPCTEGVQWIILRTPLQLSGAQLETLKTMYGVNARPIQPLNDREIQNY